MSTDWSPFLRAAMHRALALAQQGRSSTAPNPMVGAVLLRDGRIVAEGWHRHPGGPHAEAACLRGRPPELTQGADLVVTLEPCCHTGRTPPCTDIIQRAGIRRVVVATPDPNPQVAGRGLEILRAAGIEISCGLLELEARALNRHFITRMERGRPWITLKWAQSLDGRIAATAGSRTILSGPESRRETRRLRAAHPGLLIGVGTALADDPLLGLPGIPGPAFTGRAPHRLVLDSRARLPLGSRLVRSAGEQPLTVICGRAAPVDRIQCLRRQGVGVAQDPASEQPSMEWVLAQALALGLDGLLVEGGARIHGAFLAADLVDEVQSITTPSVLGHGVPAVDFPTDRARQVSFHLSARQLRGADLWLVWRPVNGGGG